VKTPSKYINVLQAFKLQNVTLANITDGKVFSECITWLLESNKFIKSLSIQKNVFQANTNYNDNLLFEKIALLISQNTILSSLSLEFQNYTNNFIKISASLSKNNSIQHLNLSNIILVNTRQI